MQYNDLTGQVAVITGAGQGIGFEIARELAISGAAVVLNDIDTSLAENAARKIQSENGKCLALAGDGADAAFINQLTETAVQHYGKLTIAIANAGITAYGSFFDFTEEALEKIIQLNLKGSFFLAQAAARQIRQQGTGGSILFMSSVTGHQAHKNLTAYGMTKAGLEMLAKSLVAELSPYRISVNAIAPGATHTERTIADPGYDKIWSRITPMGRPASVEDIANAALFLVAPVSRHITGQTLVVDGGWTSVSPSPYED